MLESSMSGIHFVVKMDFCLSLDVWQCFKLAVPGGAVAASAVQGCAALHETHVARAWLTPGHGLIDMQPRVTFFFHSYFLLPWNILPSTFPTPTQSMKFSCPWNSLRMPGAAVFDLDIYLLWNLHEHLLLRFPCCLSSYIELMPVHGDITE